MPPTTTKIESQPCMDSFQQSALPYSDFYEPEMMRSRGGCIEEPNTKLIYDPRYTEAGFFTNEYDV